MKYIKDTHIIEPNTGSIQYNGKTILNPSINTLIDAGYVKYEVPSYEPSEIQIKESRMNEIKAEIAKTDYIVLKEFEGEDVSKYGDYKKVRSALREEYNILEKNVIDLKKFE